MTLAVQRRPWETSKNQVNAIVELLDEHSGRHAFFMRTVELKPGSPTIVSNSGLVARLSCHDLKIFQERHRQAMLLGRRSRVGCWLTERRRPDPNAVQITSKVARFCPAVTGTIPAGRAPHNVGTRETGISRGRRDNFPALA